MDSALKYLDIPPNYSGLTFFFHLIHIEALLYVLHSILTVKIFENNQLTKEYVHAFV